MAVFKILVPYNFTANDQKALDFVCSLFREQPDSFITLYHVYQPIPDLPIGRDTVMEKVQSNINYLTQRTQEQESELRKACLELIKKGISETRITSAFEPKKKDVAAEIIEKAEAGNFQMIVLNRKGGRVARFLYGTGAYQSHRRHGG
jgi:hypothetical protein